MHFSNLGTILNRIENPVKCEQKDTVNEVVTAVVKQLPYFKQHVYSTQAAECFEDKKKTVNGRGPGRLP